MSVGTKNQRPATTAIAWQVIRQDNNSYRVVNPHNPDDKAVAHISRQGKLICTCADFMRHINNPLYSCAHLSAVIDADSRRSVAEAEFDEAEADYDDYPAEPTEDDFDLASAEEPETREAASALSEAADPWFEALSKTPPKPAAHMLIKRSLSPDGKINSISVEIDFAIGPDLSAEIKAQALQAIQLETEIVQTYLSEQAPPEPPPKMQAAAPTRPQSVKPAPAKPNGRALARPPAAQAQSGQSEPATMLSIGSCNSKWGPSYYIAVRLDQTDSVAKLFGNPKQLSEQIARAGYDLPSSEIADGLPLSIPCQVITQVKGKYLNVVEVLPELAEF